MYDSLAQVKLNDVIEVVGVLSVDPLLAVFTKPNEYVVRFNTTARIICNRHLSADKQVSIKFYFFF